VIVDVMVMLLMVLFGWLLVSGLRSGKMLARSASYSRAAQPRWFWTLAVVYAIGFAVCVVFAGRILSGL
jgi:hypothetical protein